MGSPSEIERKKQDDKRCGSCGAWPGELCRNQNMGRECNSAYFETIAHRDGPHISLTARTSPVLGQVKDNPYAAVADYFPAPVLTGSHSDYYRVSIVNPTTPGTEPYIAECNDIIEALDMNFAEANVFKAIWRMAANHTGRGKPGTTRKYDAEKVVFFGGRLLAQEEDFNE